MAEEQKPQEPEEPQVPPPTPPVQGTGNAIASLVLGIAGFFVCPLVCSILAIIFGYKSRNLREPAQGMATAGIILGWVEIGVFVIAFIIAMLFGFFAAFSAAPPGR